MTPQRIQLSRKKGFRLPPNTVVVSRPSKWGNPYIVGNSPSAFCAGVVDVPDAATAVKLFKSLAKSQPAFIAAVKSDLQGKNLACWCKPGSPCHADVLLEIANQ
ncbi:MAG: DUF4326 domain-containing protein [Verrucomicrobiota bacterium]